MLLGDVTAVRRFAPEVRVATSLTGGRPGELTVVEPSPGAEPVEIRAIRDAVAACRSGVARAMVTGPIHKARLAARGFHHAGHTEFLAELCGVTGPVMAFTGGQFRVALVTVHLALRDVPAAVTFDAVLHTLRTADAALRTQLGIARPRHGLCTELDFFKNTGVWIEGNRGARSITGSLAVNGKTSLGFPAIAELHLVVIAIAVNF